MNALTCFQGQTVKLFAHFAGSTWFEAWDSHPPRPSGALCNWVSAFGVPLTLGMGWNREGQAVSISPWDEHCFPKNHAGGRGGWREAFSLTAPCIAHSSPQTSSKFWGLTLPLLPLLSHSHSSLTSLEKIDHVCLWFSSDPPISSMRVAGG